MITFSLSACGLIARPGHYLLHAMEHVIEVTIRTGPFSNAGQGIAGAGGTPKSSEQGVVLPAFGHETLGRRIIDLIPRSMRS